jgi:site-specific recombinase XerC
MYLEDVNIEEGYFKVMGKGARKRIVPMGITTQMGERKCPPSVHFLKSSEMSKYDIISGVTDIPRFSGS